MEKVNFPIFGSTIAIHSDMVKYVDTLHRFQQEKDKIIAQLYDFAIQEKSEEEICNSILQLTVDVVNGIIRELSDYGVYNKTISDFIPQNHYKRVFEDYSSGVHDSISNVNRERRHDLDVAEEQADNSITGLPFGILSNSLIGVGVYALQEHSELKKQAAKANAEYFNRSRKINNYYDNLKDELKQRHRTQFVSSMGNAIDVTLDHISTSYLVEMSECGQFDASWIGGISLERSIELLMNLQVVNGAENVIKQALILCPFNPRIYMRAGEVNLLNAELKDIAEYLHIEEDIIFEIEKNCGIKQENSDLGPVEIIDLFSKPYKTISVFTGETELGVLQRYFPTVKDKIFDPFRELSETINAADEIHFLKYLKKHISALNQFRDNRDCLQFVEACTYSRGEMQRISTISGGESIILDIAGIIGYSEGKEYGGILQFLSESIAPFIRNAVQTIEKQEREQEEARIAQELREKEEQEKQHKQKIRARKRAAIIIPPIVAFGLFFFLWLVPNVLEPNAIYSRACALVEDGRYEEAIVEFKSLKGYRDAYSQISELNNRLKYQQADQCVESGYYSAAIELFLELGNYQDAKERITVLRDEALSNFSQCIQEGKFKEAYDMLNSSSNKVWTSEMQKQAKTMVEDRYNELMASGKTDDATQLSTVFELAPERTYISAKKKIEAGDYDDAYKLLASIPEYKNASTLMTAIDNIISGVYSHDDSYYMYVWTQISAETGEYKYYASRWRYDSFSNFVNQGTLTQTQTSDFEGDLIFKYAGYYRFTFSTDQSQLIVEELFDEHYAARKGEVKETIIWTQQDPDDEPAKSALYRAKRAGII